MDKLERKILAIIEEHKDEIIGIGHHIFTHAEMGYKEYKTAALAAEKLAELGITPETGLAVTGVKGWLNGEKDGPAIAVIGELDALPIPNHPDANPETGASHCCGHNAQMAGMLGAAIALTDPEIAAALDGKIAFMAVPSEEFVDTGFKLGLMEQGVIQYAGGKSELIRLGVFDDIDIAVGHHTTPGIPGYQLANNSSNGFVNKLVTFKGKSAHAAGAPHAGVDALNGAMLALHAVDLQRETFKDEDHIRVHSFLPQAGTAMNVIADTVEIESSVRGKTVEAMKDANRKYDRAMRAGAVGLGCEVEIRTIPGYLPTVPMEDPSLMIDVLNDLSAYRAEEGVHYPVSYMDKDAHTSGSTDYGEISSIMPLYQFNTGGYSGVLHNSNVEVIDQQLAYVETAKIFALTAYRLLRDGAAAAEKTLADFKPLMTREDYFRYMEEIGGTEVFKG